MTNERVSLYSLLCESLENPLGIDVKRPSLSWKLAANRRGVRQTAYQVQVSITEEWEKFVWDSGKVLSDQSVAVVYAGADLVSRQRYFWRVRVWDEGDVVTGWSETAVWETALLHATDWQAQWIEPEQKPAQPEPTIPAFQNFGMNSPMPGDDYARLNPCQYLRKGFVAQNAISKARLYATAHGVYQLTLNGVRVGDLELAPEATAYDSYLQYQTYDVTDLIKPGANVLGAVLGDGWYCGRVGLPGSSCLYGDMLALLVQLEVVYENGRSTTIISDSDFKSATGALVYSDLSIGERYDANLELGNWHEPDFDDQAWQAVNIADYGYANLVAHYGEPLRVVEEIAPVAILHTPKGETVVDFGQNINGKMRMQVQAAAPTEIVLDYFEMLDAEGNALHQIHTRNKDQRDVYVAKGGGAEQYEPLFTMHGFRYVRLTGYPGEPQLGNFVGLVMVSDMRDSGSFACSDERLNQLQKNIYWSQRGNMASLPTDCPQRERAGFTGDAQIFIATACFNMDVYPFFTRWLYSLQKDQRENGQVPVIVPYWQSYIEMFDTLHAGQHTSAGWGDACVVVPWVLYQFYGDERVLAENYETMVRWLDYVQREAEMGVPERLGEELTPEARERQRYLWNTGFHFGDWLMPSLTAVHGSPMLGAEYTKEITASTSYAYNTELMAQVAQVLGREDDYQRYSSLNGKIREAFAAEYVDDEGKLPLHHYQGMYVLALQARAVAEEKRPLLTHQLVKLIAQNGYKLDTGFVSVPYLLDVLCENGRSDIAYKLLFQTECPSWLYEVEQGATTIWEKWDAIKPDGTVQVTSYNHYAFGCVGGWLYRYVAGLDKALPGYKHIVIHPHPHEKLSWAKATYQSVYGEIVSGWEVKEGMMRVEVTIPPNTRATIHLPGAVGQAFEGVETAVLQGQDVVFEVGSGSYAFAYRWQGK